MSSTTNPVPKLYKSVVEDVISNVREAFLDEGVDEQVLQELKQLWEHKLQQSKALDLSMQDQDTLSLPATLQYAQVIPHQQSHAASRIQTVSSAGVSQTVPVPVQLAAGAGEISAPAAAAAMALPQGLFQQQLQALAAQGLSFQTGNGQFIIQVPQGQAVTGAINLPQQTLVQTQSTIPSVVQSTQGIPQNSHGMLQLDGTHDTSSSEDDDFEDDENDENDDEQNEDEDAQGEEEEPLNSEDDISDADPQELFDTDNVVVCQYDKINRNKSKWKFHLKDGIMNLNGKDYVFQKATGDADW